MKIRIKSPMGQYLGFIVSDQGKAEIVGVTDKSLLALLESGIKEGVNIMVDNYDDKNDRFVMVEKKVLSTDENFDLALIKFLENHEYDVVEEHTEFEEELRNMLQSLPENDEKKEILSKLPVMSYLERTYLFEQLKNLDI